jgi:hypothetical protein
VDHAENVKDWGLGLYAYAANNPVVVTDRLGVKSLRCQVTPWVEKDLGPVKVCILFGFCIPQFDWWDYSITFWDDYDPGLFPLSETVSVPRSRQW